LSTGGRRFAFLLLFVSACAVAVTGWIEATGGIRRDVAGVSLSVRNSFRPALLAGGCALVALAMLIRRRSDIDRATRVVSPLFDIAVWVAAGTVFALGVIFGVKAAGGSDPYGYVSQAQFWLRGNLHVPLRLAAAVPWPDADWTFTPLGYRPAAQHTLVPTYPPGLPLLMALFQVLFGASGPFLVGPLCGALLVLATDRLGTIVGGRAVGAMAALCVAASPTVLYMTVWVMSDVPAAACFAAGLWLACRRSPAASGVVTGIGIMIRPNLAPLALFPAAILLWQSTGPSFGVRLRLNAWFALGCVPFVLVPAWTNYTLYGSPWASGYGSVTDLYAWAHLPVNLARYPVWLEETQSPAVFVFLLAPFVLGRGQRAEWPVVGILAAFAAAVFALYAWYLPFKPWWFLRFLLPALPIVLIIGSLVVWRLGARLHPSTRAAVAAGFTCWMVLYGIDASRRHGVFTLRQDEQKYADVGRYIGGTLPANVVVIAMQHSGSIRLYSGREILRYDYLSPHWLDRALAHFASRGSPVYFALEDWEVPVFKNHFASQQGVTLVDQTPLAVDASHVVRLYAAERRDVPLTPAVMPATSGYALR
jgi:hypothetical protein